MVVEGMARMAAGVAGVQSGSRGGSSGAPPPYTPPDPIDKKHTFPLILRWGLIN